MSSTLWYVGVDEVVRGPAPTDLMIKGIEHRKVPPEALVCEAGAGRWVPLASVEAFHAAVVRSYPPPPPESAEARRWIEQGFRFPSPARLPSFDDIEAEASDLDIEVDEAPEPVDWSEPFESFFLVGEEVALPNERALLQSLSVASRETFLHESAQWNLALCMAYGSDELGAVAAHTFFAAVAGHGAIERIEWMGRALRGDGFMPSGIPTDAGLRGVRRLRNSCPPPLRRKLS